MNQSKPADRLGGYILRQANGHKLTCYREMAAQKFLGATLEEIARARSGEKVAMHNGGTLTWAAS